MGGTLRCGDALVCWGVGGTWGAHWDVGEHTGVHEDMLRVCGGTQWGDVLGCVEILWCLGTCWGCVLDGMWGQIGF